MRKIHQRCALGNTIGRSKTSSPVVISKYAASGSGMDFEHWSERWSIRKIERHLKMGWRTISKYLEQDSGAPQPFEQNRFLAHLAEVQALAPLHEIDDRAVILIVQHREIQ